MWKSQQRFSVYSIVITLQLNFEKEYTIDYTTGTTFTFGINGNLIKNPDLYRKTLVFGCPTSSLAQRRPFLMDPQLNVQYISYAWI